jgi:hypothetical protein
MCQKSSINLIHILKESLMHALHELAIDPMYESRRRMVRGVTRNLGISQLLGVTGRCKCTITDTQIVMVLYGMILTTYLTSLGVKPMLPGWRRWRELRRAGGRQKCRMSKKLLTQAVPTQVLEALRA